MDYFKNGIVRHASTISVAERHQMIKEYLETDQTKVEIWRKYTGYRGEHGGLLKWMRMYGYVDDDIKRRPTSPVPAGINQTFIGPNTNPMTREQRESMNRRYEAERNWEKFISEGQQRDPFVFGGGEFGFGFARTTADAIQEAPYVIAPEIAGAKLLKWYRGLKYAKIGSTGKVGESALRAFGLGKKTFDTTKGLRFVDGFGVTDDGIRIAVESKVGRTSLSEFVQKQIAKDAELLATGEVDQVIWRFAKSPKTGKVGPTAPLREALQKEGIKILEVQ